jgi:hypothetical protein
VAEFFQDPTSDVSFGDVYEGVFFFDAFLRDDACQMGTRAGKGGSVVYSPDWADKRNFVLARGAPCAALLITENCLVDTALGQGRADSKPKGRLLFAPIWEAETDADLKTTTFGRFPMPGWEDRLPASVAELRRCFMVDSRDVGARARLASLGSEAVVDLEVRWNAFATRRGPRASARNAEKVTDVLVKLQGRSERTERDEETGTLVAQTLAAAWRIEGGELPAAAEAAPEPPSAGPSADDSAKGTQSGRSEIEQLQSALRSLATTAEAAAERSR